MFPYMFLTQRLSKWNTFMYLSLFFEQFLVSHSNTKQCQLTLTSEYNICLYASGNFFLPTLNVPCIQTPKGKMFPHLFKHMSSSSKKACVYTVILTYCIKVKHNINAPCFTLILRSSQIQFQWNGCSGNQGIWADHSQWSTVWCAETRLQVLDCTVALTVDGILCILTAAYCCVMSAISGTLTHSDWHTHFLCVQGVIMERSVVRDVKVSSSAVWGRTWPIAAAAARTASSTNTTAIAASSVGWWNALRWGWRPSVSLHPPPEHHSDACRHKNTVTLKYMLLTKRICVCSILERSVRKTLEAENKISL